LPIKSIEISEKLLAQETLALLEGKIKLKSLLENSLEV